MSTRPLTNIDRVLEDLVVGVRNLEDLVAGVRGLERPAYRVRRPREITSSLCVSEPPCEVCGRKLERRCIKRTQ